jgi:hypothetical protein
MSEATTTTQFSAPPSEPAKRVFSRLRAMEDGALDFPPLTGLASDPDDTGQCIG